MRYPFTASQENISILFDGKMHGIPKQHPSFAELYAHLKSPEHDYTTISGLIETEKMLARLTSGAVTVIGDSVFHAGVVIRNSVTEKLLNLLEEGFDAKPWALFLDNLMLNPSTRSRDCLFDYLDKSQAPITDDGCFIAFKLVRDDFTDCHTGTFDNSPGQVVSMTRSEVNPDPNVTCSHGLHVCGLGYFGSNFGGSKRRILCVKVHPADVVAVPYDYNNAKMRVCRYEVISEVDNSVQTPEQVAAQPLVNTGAAVIPDALNAFPSGSVVDMKHLPEYRSDATTFAQDWCVKPDMEPCEGAYIIVTPAGWEVQDPYTVTQLPKHTYSIGVVQRCNTAPSYSNFEGGAREKGYRLWAEVLWQDGLYSGDLLYDPHTPEKREVSVVMPRTMEVFRNALSTDSLFETWFGADNTNDDADFPEDEMLWGEDFEDEGFDHDFFADEEDVVEKPSFEALHDEDDLGIMAKYGITFVDDEYAFPTPCGENLNSDQVIMYGAIYGKRGGADHVDVPLDEFTLWCEMATDYLQYREAAQ